MRNKCTFLGLLIICISEYKTTLIDKKYINSLLRECGIQIRCEKNKNGSEKSKIKNRKRVRRFYLKQYGKIEKEIIDTEIEIECPFPIECVKKRKIYY